MPGINPGDSFTFHECNDLLSPKPTINISNITLLIRKSAGWMSNVPLSNTNQRLPAEQGPGPFEGPFSFALLCWWSLICDSTINMFSQPKAGPPIDARGILKIF